MSTPHILNQIEQLQQNGNKLTTGVPIKDVANCYKYLACRDGIQLTDAIHVNDHIMAVCTTGIAEYCILIDDPWISMAKEWGVVPIGNPCQVTAHTTVALVLDLI
jgi:hypothetical protein